MPIPKELAEVVRARAGWACEYCGVTETGAGGELTIDHFQPRSVGGQDELENLIYCCFRCNLYKADYWPTTAGSPELWNPRHEPAESHLLLLADGTLCPVTTAGAFTINRLRLNRRPLVAYRLARRAELDERDLLSRYREVIALLEQLHRQRASLLEEQRRLLEEERSLLRLLSEGNE